MNSYFVDVIVGSDVFFSDVICFSFIQTCRNASQAAIARVENIATHFSVSARSSRTLVRAAHKRTSATARMGNTDARGVAVLQIPNKEV